MQAAGGVPRGDLALLNTVVVGVIVIVVAVVDHSEHLVDIIAVKKQPLERGAAVGLLGLIVTHESSPSIWPSWSLYFHVLLTVHYPGDNQTNVGQQRKKC